MQTEDWHGPPEGGRDEGAPPVEELLLRWEQAREQGQPVTPEELCRDCPEYLPALRRCIALLGAVDEVMDLGATADHPPRGPEEFPEIPGYEIEAELDRGGMGVVYRARHRILGQPRAVKVIRPGLGVHPNA